MKISNYSITIELTMTRLLRFPYGCDIKRLDDFFVNHRHTSEDNKEKVLYSKAINVLRQAKAFGASLDCISSEFINKEHICRISFSFRELESLVKFVTAVNSI